MLKAWQHRLELKDLLCEELDSDSVEIAAKGMHERLEKFRLKHFPDDDELERLSDEFHTIGFVDGPEGAADYRDFNYTLDNLYDWADYDKRLWID